MKPSIRLVHLGLTALLLTISGLGCNTIRGAGQDIEEGGEVIQDAADDAQN